MQEKIKATIKIVSIVDTSGEYNAELKSCIIFFKCPFCSIARANHWTRHDF